MAAIELGPTGWMTAVAEPTRRGGGAATVVLVDEGVDPPTLEG